MFKKDDKRYLYWIIEEYLENHISSRVFCDSFYEAYDLELNSRDLSSIELKVFSQLGTIANRFSEFQEDIDQYPGVYFSEVELKEAIMSAKKKLQDQ